MRIFVCISRASKLLLLICRASKLFLLVRRASKLVVGLDHAGQSLGRIFGLELGFLEQLVALGLGRTCHWLRHELKCGQIIVVAFFPVLLALGSYILLAPGTYGFERWPILGFILRSCSLVFNLVFRLQIKIVFHGKFS